MEPPSAVQPELSDLAAIERFVVENDDLLSLEEMIGRFNIFDALGVARVEIRHSNFLAWLLDPSESHGHGDAFLKAVLMDLLRQATPEMRPLSPVDLDGVTLAGVEVRREWRNIDLLIVCRNPSFIVAIENKVDAGESKGQLERYKGIVAESFSDAKPLFVFLTTDGTEPSDAQWLPYSYQDVHRVLTRCRRTGAGAIGQDVGVFLDHYLRLIGSRFMQDDTIDELCQRIYQNHRQALDLIFERIQPLSSGLTAAVDAALRDHPTKWVFRKRTARELHFIPESWLSALPPIGMSSGKHPRGWLVFQLFVSDSFCRLTLLVCPATDQRVRSELIECLTRDGNEFGLKVKLKKGPTEKWTRLCTERAYAWSEDDGPDIEAGTAKIMERVDILAKRLARVPEVLRSELSSPPK